MGLVNIINHHLKILFLTFSKKKKKKYFVDFKNFFFFRSLCAGLSK